MKKRLMNYLGLIVIMLSLLINPLNIFAETQTVYPDALLQNNNEKIIEFENEEMQLNSSSEKSKAVQLLNFNIERASRNIIGDVSLGEVKAKYWDPELGWTDLKQEGASFVLGTEVNFRINWEILNISSKDIQADDWFEIDLPGDYFYFTSSEEVNVSAIDENGQRIEIGKMQLIGQDNATNPKIRFVINETATSKQYLKNGYFEVTGTANIEKKATDKVVIGNEVLPPIEVTPPVYDQEYTDKGDFLKDGWQISNQNKIIWQFDINNQEYKNVFNGGKLGEPKKDVVLIDELPSGLSFESIEIASPIYLATPSGKMSNTPVAYGWNGVDTDFSRITQYTNESWEQFQKRVEQQEQPTIGIYHDFTDSRNKIIIKFGDIPGSITNPKTLSEIEALIDNDLRVTGEVKQKTKNAYQHIFSETAKGVIGYTVFVNTKVLDGTGKYENNASLKWHTNKIESGKVPVNFVSIGGGATTGDPGSVIINKRDINTREGLEGAKFKLQIESPENSGQFIDFVNHDNGPKIRETNELGQVVFGKLDNGKYKIVEVSPPTGYSANAIFEPEDTFSITGAEQGSLFVTVLNEKEVPNEVSVSLMANKVLNGKKLLADEFEFLLVDAHGNEIEKVKNDAKGAIIFSELTYKDVGKYTYTISEIADSQKGITYDSHKIEAIVSVTNNDGKLVAEVEYQGEQTFVNKYKSNSKENILPRTGDSIQMGYKVVGLLLICLVASIFIFQCKKRNLD